MPDKYMVEIHNEIVKAEHETGNKSEPDQISRIALEFQQVLHRKIADVYNTIFGYSFIAPEVTQLTFDQVFQHVEKNTTTYTKNKTDCEFAIAGYYSAVNRRVIEATKLMQIADGPQISGIRSIFTKMLSSCIRRANPSDSIAICQLIFKSDLSIVYIDELFRNENSDSNLRIKFYQAAKGMINGLTNEVDRLTADCSKMGELQVQLSTQQEHLAAQREQLVKQRESLADQQEQISAQQEQIAHYKNELEHAKSTISIRDEEIAERIAERKKHEQQQAEQSAIIAKQTTDYKAVIRENILYENTIQKLNADHQKLCEQYVTVKETLFNLQLKTAKQQTETNNVPKQNDDPKQIEITTQYQIIDQQLSKISTLRLEIAQQQAKLDQQQVVDKHQKEIVALQQALIDEIITKIQSAANYEELVGSLTPNYQIAVRAKQQLEQKINLLNVTNEPTDRIGTLTNANEKLSSENETLRLELTKLKDTSAKQNQLAENYRQLYTAYNKLVELCTMCGFFNDDSYFEKKFISDK